MIWNLLSTLLAAINTVGRQNAPPPPPPEKTTFGGASLIQTTILIVVIVGCLAGWIGEVQEDRNVKSKKIKGFKMHNSGMTEEWGAKVGQLEGEPHEHPSESYS
ncbi:hypothetical protein IAR50_004881 [Cryptococcus sp. DSM 104548]